MIFDGLLQNIVAEVFLGRSAQISHKVLWLSHNCHEKVKLIFNIFVVIPNEMSQIAFDGFSTLISELVINT